VGHFQVKCEEYIITLRNDLPIYIVLIAKSKDIIAKQHQKQRKSPRNVSFWY